MNDEFALRFDFKNFHSESREKELRKSPELIDLDLSELMLTFRSFQNHKEHIREEDNSQ